MSTTIRLTRGCPFCGQPRTEVRKHRAGAHRQYTIQCTSCGCSTPRRSTIHAARAVWNKRATPAASEIAALREQLSRLSADAAATAALFDDATGEDDAAD